MFTFCTQANTLDKLRHSIRRCAIPPSHVFSVAQWNKGRVGVIAGTRSALACPIVIVRSSARGEDSYWSQRFDDVLSDAETLEMDGDGLLTDIGNKPKRLDQIQGQYIGLMRFRGAGATSLRSMLAKLDDSVAINGRPARSAYMTDLLQSMIASGLRVDAVPFKAPWCEVDSSADLAIAETRARDWISELFGTRGS